MVQMSLRCNVIMRILAQSLLSENRYFVRDAFFGQFSVQKLNLIYEIYLNFPFKLV